MEMYMMTCNYCKGTGKAEKEIKDEFGNVEWEECDCPKCHGEKEYEVEYFDCKIF